ncbi:hypothetical protein J6590_068488 [Homalodisca vitripennis]|nr:hypothetical protein J6590_068488 [Homalodisca vitripennis]
MGAFVQRHVASAITKQTSAPEKAALAHPHTCSPAYLSSLDIASIPRTTLPVPVVETPADLAVPLYCRFSTANDPTSTNGPTSAMAHQRSQSSRWYNRVILCAITGEDLVVITLGLQQVAETVSSIHELLRMFYPLGSDIPSRNLYYFTSDQVYTWEEEQKEMEEPKDH